MGIRLGPWGRRSAGTGLRKSMGSKARRTRSAPRRPIPGGASSGGGGGSSRGRAAPAPPPPPAAPVDTGIYTKDTGIYTKDTGVYTKEGPA